VVEVPWKYLKCDYYCFVESSYDNNFSKIALAITSAQLAKKMSIKEFGVGEDLAFNFLGWVEDRLEIICQMKKPIMDLEHSERLTRSGHMCTALRKYWGVTDLTMIAEGFCSRDSSKTQGLDLAKVYAERDSDVTECITVAHASLTNDKMLSDLVALPYRYLADNEVEWGEILTYPGNADKVLRNSSFPKMLRKSLSEPVFEEDLPEDAYFELKEAINNNGFYIQELPE
jgi:hypothetical protein